MLRAIEARRPGEKQRLLDLDQSGPRRLNLTVSSSGAVEVLRASHTRAQPDMSTALHNEVYGCSATSASKREGRDV